MATVAASASSASLGILISALLSQATLGMPPTGRVPEETELIEPLASMWVALDHVPLVLRVLSQIPDPGTRPWKCNVPSGSPADAMSVTEPLVSMWMALAAQVPLALRTRSQVPLPGTRVNTCSVPFGNDAAATCVIDGLVSISTAWDAHTPLALRVRSHTVPCGSSGRILS